MWTKRARFTALHDQARRRLRLNDPGPLATPPPTPDADCSVAKAWDYHV